LSYARSSSLTAAQTSL